MATHIYEWGRDITITVGFVAVSLHGDNKSGVSGDFTWFKSQFMFRGPKRLCHLTERLQHNHNLPLYLRLCRSAQ